MEVRAGNRPEEQDSGGVPAPGTEGHLPDWLDKIFARPERVVLFVLIAQILIFSISWGQFFCGDSFYYLSRLTRSWSTFARNFVREDDVGQYRPLTYPVFTYLVYPLGRLQPIVYHWIGLAVHVVVSLL